MSQIAEQVIRVIWMLLATFFIMKLGSKDYLSAVTQSTFAAFVGMVASFAVLIYFLYTRRITQKVFETRDKIDSKRLLVDTIKEAIPLSWLVRPFSFSKFWTKWPLSIVWSGLPTIAMKT